MIRKLVPFVLGSTLFAACAMEDSVTETEESLAGHPGRYVIVFKSERLPGDALARITRAGGTPVRSLSDVGVATASGDAVFASQLAKDSAVLAVGPEHLYNLPEVTRLEVSDEEIGAVEGAPTPADNLYFYQWDMRRMGVPSVWARLPLASTQTRVAVLDSGFMHDHPDLAGQACELKSFTYCNTSGGVPASPAYPAYSTLIDFDQFPIWNPSDGCTAAATYYDAHGTHTSGTVAAKFGGGRVVGVAPDACVGAYKVFDRYRYTDPVDGVVDAIGAFDGPLYGAIVDAVNAGYPVISMSLGSTHVMGPGSGNASWLAWNRVTNYANRRGTVIVGSAGNAALDLNGPIVHVPSDLPTVISVGATGSNDLRLVGGQFVAQPGSDVLAFYSNYGSANDVSAPGGDCGPAYPNRCVAQHLILSTTISATGGIQYAFFAGTSMATPHVAAVAAQVRAMHPELSPGAVRSWLKDRAEDLGNRQLFGAGMVRADLATQ